MFLKIGRYAALSETVINHIPVRLYFIDKSRSFEIALPLSFIANILHKCSSARLFLDSYAYPKWLVIKKNSMMKRSRG